MNRVLQVEAMTIAQIQLLVDRENARRIKNREKLNTWIESKKAQGDFYNRRKEYNAKYRAKKKAEKEALAEPKEVDNGIP